MLRTIMIFPQFENISVIDNIRSEISNDELAQLLEKRLLGINSFEISLNGFSKKKDRLSNYLFLNVTKGIDEIRNIHNILYEHEFKKFDLGYGYIPHMTVGKFSKIQLLEEAFEDISLNCELFNTIVDKVSVEMIGKNEESIITIEKNLA
ncbi:MAG: 2'-5' RNA ligase family protein [Mobilitalea sp.]